MRSVLMSVVLASGIAGTAFADIKAFNAAVQAGDYRGATIAANETWPTIDTNAPDAAATAREFAWIAMLAGEPTSALVYSRFLVDSGPQLAHPDTSPAVSRVLHDWANMAANASPQARVRLQQSLMARAAVIGKDLISTRAAQDLFAEFWSAGEWSQAESAAMLTNRFLDDLGVDKALARFQARRTQAMANFMRTKTTDAYDKLYDIASEVHDLIAATPAGPARERLAREYYAATAWADAIYGGLSASRQRQLTDRRMSITAGRIPMAELVYPAPGETSLPRCRIALGGAKTPGFPFVARFKDVGGAVTYAVDVAPNGMFANPRLLAAAPHPDFARAAEDGIGTWRWKVDGSIQPPNCRMPQTHILTFEFALGR